MTLGQKLYQFWVYVNHSIDRPSHGFR